MSRGLTSVVVPGCTETYQSFQRAEQQQQQQEQGPQQRYQEEHQKVQRIRQGDILAVPAGLTHWCYNDGDAPLIMVQVFDISNSANQLDQRHRDFLLAGRQQQTQQTVGAQEQQRQQSNNLLSGFNLDILAEAMGVDRELARKIQCMNDQRGEIVRVPSGLQYLGASQAIQTAEEYEGQRQCGQEAMSRQQGCGNGLEETMCNLKNRENIADANRADFYNPQSGRLTILNSQKLAILAVLQMSAEKGTLYQNAIYAPHWNLNAHSVIYVIRGSCHMQVVGHRGNTVFDGELRQGQLIVVPQNYAAMKKAQTPQFEWVAFKTNDNAIVNQISGKASALRGIPEEVLVNAYRISRAEAKVLKFNRGYETILFTPKYQGRPFVA